LSNDISNEVKRTSLVALGFVMYHDDKLIDIIKMLFYSYNPYIRYGCAIALAIGCKDNKEAIEMIWPLLTDNVDFVRQGAYISLGILLQVSTNNSEPRLEEFRKNIKELFGKTHVDNMVKMGAILAVGLLDIGGRNMSICLTSRSGMPKIEAISGILIFCQYWNWFPYLNMVSLSLSPSVFIGITCKLRIPKDFQIKSNCRLSMFDYPANIVVEEKKNGSKKEATK
jgi:26S proteasome regulatory subunit N2